MPSLEERRKALRLSIAELARRAGHDQNTVARILRNENGLVRTRLAVTRAITTEENRLHLYLSGVIAEPRAMAGATQGLA